MPVPMPMPMPFCSKQRYHVPKTKTIGADNHNNGDFTPAASDDEGNGGQSPGSEGKGEEGDSEFTSANHPHAEDDVDEDEHEGGASFGSGFSDGGSEAGSL